MKGVIKMKVFIHSTNPSLDGTTLKTKEKLLYAIYAKYNKSGFGRTHFDILDDKTYREIFDMYNNFLVLSRVQLGTIEEINEEIIKELKSMLMEYIRYIEDIDESAYAYCALNMYNENPKTHLSSVYGTCVTGGNNNEQF